jgi:hypothetical protein
MTSYPTSLREMGIHYFPDTLVFNQTNLADANGDMESWEASNILGPPAAFPGFVVGISVYTNADLTGGVITFAPSVAGTPDTDLAVVLDDTHQQAYAMIPPTLVPFAAGDKLGINYTKTGTVAPATTDVVGKLLVVYAIGAGIASG